ncbi:MAG: hypothetical protein AAGG01_02420 [Planctomycetota bacterium]
MAFNRLLVLAASALASTLAATSAEAAAPAQLRGMTSVWSVALSADGGPTSGSMIDPMLMKLPTNQNGAPQPWAPLHNVGAPTPVIPNYSMEAIFGDDAEFIEIDGHSSGGDLIPYPDSLGAPAVSQATDNWLAYVLSVKNGSEGQEDSYINQVSQTRPVGAELLGFYASGSQNIDTSLVGQTTVEHTALSLGYPAQAPEEIDALDFNIGINTASPANVNAWMFPNTEEFYFTITFATTVEWFTRYGSAPFATYGSTSREPRPGDVYVVYWEGNGWSEIDLYRSAEDLGLEFFEEVDALSVSRYNGVVIFSTELNGLYPNRPQLLINTGMPGSTTELMDLDSGGNYTPVTDQVDLSNEKDDVDGVCGIDPEGKDQYDPSGGIAVTSVTKSNNPALAGIFGDDPMNLSMQRGVLAAGGADHISVQVSGWGNAQPTAGQIQLFVYESDEPMMPNVDPLAPFQNVFGQTVTPIWTPFAPMPRAQSQEQWEFSIPFDAARQGRNLAVMAVQFSSDGVIAGSHVTQISW